MSEEPRPEIGGGYRSLMIGDEAGLALSVRLAAYDLTKSVGKSLDEITRRCGFSTFGDYQVVAMAVRSGGWIRPRALAVGLEVTRAGVSGRVDRLARQGLVRRKQSDGSATVDRRSVFIEVLDKGNGAHERVQIEIDAFDARIEAAVEPDSLRQLAQLLEHTRAALRIGEISND